MRNGTVQRRERGVFLIGLAGMLLGAVLSAVGQEQGINWVARPGFEASDSSLRAKWHLPESEWEIDRSEKHTGNQCLKLTAGAPSRSRGASCLLPADRIKAPCRVIVSAWSKAANVSGGKDNNYAIYVDVAYTDGTHLYGVNVPFDTDAHDWQYASMVVDVAKPVKMFSLHLLFRGSHTGTVWFDDVFASEYKEGMAKYEGSPLAYTTPVRVTEARRRAAALQEKIAALERSIKTAEERGMEASCPRVTLAVARLFADLIPKDAQFEVEDYPPDMIEFRILGKEETVKRIEALSDFEAKETERILDRAIQEVDQALKGNLVLPKVPPSEIKEVSIKNGAFWSGDHPVFASGIHNTAFGLRKPEWLDTFKQLGANLVGPLHVSDACCKGWDTFDEAYFRDQILPLYRVAEEKGMLVVPGVWNYRAPAWLEELAPDISVTERRGWLREAGDDVAQERGWFRDAFDIDHPLTERYQKSWLRCVASHLKTAPNNLTYSLMGEEWCNPTYRSPHTAARYEAWLKAKHGSIEGVNKAWGTQYKDFKEAVARASQSTPGGRYDWYSFNEDRLTIYNQWQIDGIRSAHPEGLPSCWPAAGGLVSVPLGGFDPAYGRNREEIIRQSAVTGWDGGIFPVEAGATTRRLEKSHWAKYILGWRDEMIYYDFAKSVCPDKPVFDPELHSITSVYHITPLGVSEDYVRASLWLEHLHGLGAHILWWWGRRDDGMPYFGEFLGGLLTQPQFLESWGRTVLELRRLTPYVALFPQLDRKVRILYSEASAIHDGKTYPYDVEKLYEALYLCDYPAGFVTDKMIEEGKLSDCTLLLIPNGRYVSEATVAAIAAYSQKGNKVALAGAEPMKCDEYGKERPAPAFFAQAVRLTGDTAEEFSPQIDRMMDEVGIERTVRVLDKEGRKVWGVELRTAVKDGARIVSLMNLNHEPAQLVLKAKPEAGQARDLIEDKPFPLDRPFTLKPRTPMLLELR